MGTHVRIIRVAITWCIETENYGIQEGQKAWEFSIALFHLERNHLFFENFMCILIILTTFPYRHQRFPEPLSFIIHLTFCVLIFSLSLPICDAQILDMQPSTGGCWGTTEVNNRQQLYGWGKDFVSNSSFCSWYFLWL